MGSGEHDRIVTFRMRRAGPGFALASCCVTKLAIPGDFLTFLLIPAECLEDVAGSFYSLAKETQAEVCELKCRGKGNAVPSHISFSLEHGCDAWSQSSHLVTMKEKPEQFIAGRKSGSCPRQPSASNLLIRSTPIPPKYTHWDLDFLLFLDWKTHLPQIQ